MGSKSFVESRKTESDGYCEGRVSILSNFILFVDAYKRRLEQTSADKR